MTQTFRVLSLLALINILPSALHASRYTAPTWPRSVAINFPVRPSHIRTLLSQAADAAHRPSGENATCDICRWWPVNRATGLVIECWPEDDGDDAGKGDHRKRVWSSEPEMSNSGVVRRSASYRVFASAWAGKTLSVNRDKRRWSRSYLLHLMLAFYQYDRTALFEEQNRC